MAFTDLRDFIRALERAGELKRISFEVDPYLEITEFADRAVKQGGPALLFENPKAAQAAGRGPETSKETERGKEPSGESVVLRGSSKAHRPLDAAPNERETRRTWPHPASPLCASFSEGSRVPVLINAFASVRRMQIALGVENIDQIAGRIVEFLEMQKPEGLFDKLKMLPKLGEISSMFPKRVATGACKEVIRRKGEFSLDYFPILHCWPGDGGRFITLPMVFSNSPETGKRNCGMYRMQVFDGQTTGMHWQKHKHGAEHYRRLLAEGKQNRMPVAVAIGSDPATLFSAILPLPPSVDEMLFAGFLRGRAVGMVKCETSDIEVPANSEIVLEGYLNLGELRREGPFGDHTGFYSLDDEYPVFHVECVTHRRNPVYAATIVGPPPMEDFYMGKAIERIFLPLMKMQLPEVRDICMPAEGVFHNLILVSIRKSYPGHARKVMHAIWGLGQAMFSKCIVVVDDDVNVQNVNEVAWKALNNIDPERDIEFVKGPVDSLDHSSRLPNFGSKMGVDATTKWPAEGFARRWPNVIEMSPEVVKRVDELWKRAGLPRAQ